MDRRTDKQYVVNIYTIECYSAIKKNQIMPATWMDLQIIILSELSQTEKDKCHMIALQVESKN